MRVDHQRLIHFAWVLTSVAIFLLGVDPCLLQVGGCSGTSVFMLIAMTILTLPSGLFYLAVIGLLFNHSDFADPVVYFLLWLVAFIIGYVQWFVVVPGLCTLGGTMTTLGLAKGGTFEGKKKKRRARTRRRRKKILKAPPEGVGLAQWDERGRTPLERAMDERPRPS